MWLSARPESASGEIGIDLQRLLEQGTSPLRLFTPIDPLEDTQALQRRVDAGEARPA